MKRIPLIEMQGIRKTFPGVIANDDISFRVYPGEIHALLGENGAGKSTLMSILAGLYRPDEGILKVKNKITRFRSPRQALESGIGMIYQHFRLIENFTAAENIVLGTKSGFKLNKKQIESLTKSLSNKYGLNVDPGVMINQLSLGEQQRVEILKMLYRGCDVLIMDEPTTVLTPQEVEELFKVLRSMADQGKAVVLITHKLSEVMRIADYVTVLRRGKVVGSDRIENLNEKTLTSMMVAREVLYNEARREKCPGDVVLNIKNLNIKADQGHLAVKNLNLDVKQGEIMAIAGVAGNGQKELIEAIAGLRPIKSGEITLDDTVINDLSVRQRLEKGINMVPEDRIGIGLVPGLNALDNSILRSYYKSEYSGKTFLNYKLIEDTAKELVDTYNIYVADLKHPVNYMSGGNLQKLILGREIRQNPRLLLASYPVRGLDVAAAESVYRIFLEEREKGMAILLVIEDLDDIFRLADRVAVMYDGQVQAIINVEDADINRIGALMLGA